MDTPDEEYIPTLRSRRLKRKLEKLTDNSSECSTELSLNPSTPEAKGNREFQESKSISPKKKARRKRWTAAEDVALRRAVRQYGACSWKKIASTVGSRSDLQCFHRWQKVLRPGLTKGPWTKEEDEILLGEVSKGVFKWAVIARKIPGRLGKSIRERYHNHLDPTIKRGPWTEEEDKVLSEAQTRLGNKWAQIAKLIPGRPENMVKNRWYVLKYPKKKGGVRRKTMSSPCPIRKRSTPMIRPKPRETAVPVTGFCGIPQNKSVEDYSIVDAALLLLSFCH